MNYLHQISERDTVVTCLKPMEKGEQLDWQGRTLTVGANIPVFHKMAVTTMSKSSYCYKYGEVIGRCLVDINPGDYVHIHNLESTRGRGDIKND